MKKSFDILFIGNSYTFFNDMPETCFKKAAEEAGYDVTVTAITKGGAYLYQYADSEHEQGKRLRQAISGKKYDVVVIQEQSLNPIKDESSFLNGVRDIRELIDSEHFVLYATWGRNIGSATLAELALTREEMTEKLSIAYNKAAKLYDMRVAEVGKAFLDYEPRNDLYHEDRSHPSAIGSRVAASVIFETVRSYLE